MIPDYVLPRDVPAIYNYFKTFNIADVESVEYRDHEEPEYWVEDKPFYGYAIIKIKEWYDNTCTKNFYENLQNRNCKMVYDDPYYWKLEFYNLYPESNLENTDESKVESPNYIESPLPNELPMPNSNWLNTNNNKEEEEEEEEEDNYSEYYSGDEEDDVKDLDYEFAETDSEEDYEYEYLYLYSKIDKNITLKKTKKPKKNYCNENRDIKDAMVSKNYMKRNKRKDFKNVWVRRLRQKVN